jgi:hypothetical protein
VLKANSFLGRFMLAEGGEEEQAVFAAALKAEPEAATEELYYRLSGDQVEDVLREVDKARAKKNGRRR